MRGGRETGCAGVKCGAVRRSLACTCMPSARPGPAGPEGGPGWQSGSGERNHAVSPTSPLLGTALTNSCTTTSTPSPLSNSAQILGICFNGGILVVRGGVLLPQMLSQLLPTPNASPLSPQPPAEARPAAASPLPAAGSSSPHSAGGGPGRLCWARLGSARWGRARHRRARHGTARRAPPSLCLPPSRWWGGRTGAGRRGRAAALSVAPWSSCRHEGAAQRVRRSGARRQVPAGLRGQAAGERSRRRRGGDRRGALLRGAARSTPSRARARGSPRLGAGLVLGKRGSCDLLRLRSWLSEPGARREMALAGAGRLCKANRQRAGSSWRGRLSAGPSG